jgi:hypothetical protein
MEDAAGTARRNLRWSFYVLLIALATGEMTGRLLAVNSVNRIDLERSAISKRIGSLEKRLRDKGLSPAEVQQRVESERPKIEAEEQRQRPFLSSNDRSRWLAVRALVELGQFEIDPLLDRHLWNTIDMVQHRGRDGELHLYSSKPPLFYTLLAGEYWLIHRLTGLTLADHPYAVGRAILLTVNVLPMILLLVVVASLAERLGTTDWGRVFVVATAACGTLLTPFAVTLNNHLPAAVTAGLTLYAWYRIEGDRDPRWRWYLLAGVAAALTAANELPALALLVGVGGRLGWFDARKCLLGFLPAAGLVIAAYFATNYAAHQSLRPPYMHRSETDPHDNWYTYQYTVDGRQISSYWLDPQGIDRGEPSRATYIWHTLIGHHGIFSLTPVWLLSLLGIAVWSTHDRKEVRHLTLAIAGLSLLCLVFYLGLRPQIDRNYGGMTAGLRWMFWFTPLWLVVMLPAADWMGRTRWGQAVAATLLAFSVLSANFPTWNPWEHPWLYQWWEACTSAPNI